MSRILKIETNGMTFISTAIFQDSVIIIFHLMLYVFVISSFISSFLNKPSAT